MKPSSFKSLLALSVILTAAQQIAFADPDAPKPYTASELPIMATTPNLIYGGYGPQLKLGASTFETLPSPVYFDKTLEAQLGQGSVSVDGLSVMFPEALNGLNQTTTGTQSLDAEQIKAKVQGYLEQAQKEGMLCDAAVSLEQGQLKLVLTPLQLESVSISADDEWQQKTLNHLLRGLEPNQPIDLDSMQKQLRLSQQNPDLSFTSTLEAIPYTHQAKLSVVSQGHKMPVHVVGSFNNLDQIIFGHHFGGLSLVANNVTNHGDSLLVAGVRGHRSTGVFTRYELPITPAFRAFMDYQYAAIAPYDAYYTGFDTDGFAYKVSPGVKYVFFDQPTKRLSTDFAFDFKQSNTRSDNDPIEREAARTLKLGLNYDQTWDKTALSMRHEFAAGVPIFSGSLSTDPRLSWFRGGSQYFRYTGYSSLTRQMPWNSTGSLNLQWQYTPDGLTNFDVGGIGGTFYGRGYREVYLFMDTYAVLNAQWQVPAKFIPKGWRMPFSESDLRDTTQLLGFVDYGYGNTSHSPASYDGTDHILSTGVGLRTQLTKRISGRVDVGFPLLREVPFSNAPRFHFGVDTVLF